MNALISECGRYRYWLTRHGLTELPDAGSALFVMLNPSTADASIDDPTIRRCIGFARGWGCAGLAVANLYALRSTDPRGLWAADDPVGPENDRHLRYLLRAYGDAVCAWGANARSNRVQRFAEIAEDAGARLWCLGTTKHGAPKHPLYIKADTRLVRYTPPQQGLEP